MQAKTKTNSELIKENEELQTRLKEAEDKLIIYEKSEIRLLSAQKLAQSILDQSTEVIIICDENGRIIQLSQVAHRYFGAKLLQQPFDSICPLSLVQSSPLQPKQFSISSVLSGKIIRSLEVTHRRDDAKESYFLLNARPLIHNGKGILGCVVNLTDITERKLPEQDRMRLHTDTENKRRHLEALMEALPVGVSFSDDPTCQRITGNAALLAQFEVTQAENISASAPDAAAVGRQVRYFRDGRELSNAELPLQRAVAENKIIPPMELEVHLPSGRRWFTEASGAPILDVQGNVIGGLAVTVDITDRKRAEEALQRSEKRYRSYIELTEQLGWTTDANGEVVEDIPTWRKFTGQSEEEIRGWGWSKALHPDDRERIVQIWRNAIAAKTHYEAEYRVQRHDGVYRHFLTHGVPVFNDDGNIQEWVGTCIDITERKGMEEELRKSHDELEIRVQERMKEVKEQSRILDSFFKFSITPFVILDKDFNFIRVNEAYANACHRAVSEFPGHNHFEFYPSDAKAKFEQVVQTKKPYVATAKPFSFPDNPEWGTSYWDWTLTPILDDMGKVEYLVFSLEDVTKRKRADGAIKGERQRFYDVLEMLPAYLVLLTPDYHVPFANRFFRERFGESHGNRCFEYLFGRSEPCEICETYTVLKTIAPHHWEWTGPDGHIYDVFDFPFTDTDGSTIILEMGIDITERKRAEEQLKVAQQYTRSLIEASLDPLITISADGKIMDVNTATELATGVTRKQLIGSDFSDYFAEPEKAREGYRTVFMKGTVRDYPLAIRHRSGMITDVLYNATIYRNEAGEIQGIFAAARDITERKRAEEALRESENRLRHLSTQLLTVQENERKRISREIHDSLGQSLSAIKFKVESITQQMRESRSKKMAESLETLLPIIQMSIEESRRIQMDLRPSVLDDLGILPTLEWFCREYQKIYSHIRIEKKSDVKESDVPKSIKTEIYRVAQEALNNIAKHSKANFVRLSLEKKEDKIELIIQDNGMGFDLEETLYQARSKRGLGLSSMKERTELSGGSFAIVSIPGEGTTIRASWPI